jgi:hypothetical protein
MSDWKHVQRDPSEQLAQLHFFSVKKQHPSGPLEMRITVWEFATPEISDLTFFAQTDIELNQGTVPFRPCGWSNTLMGALSECLRNIRKFEFEEERRQSADSTQ